MLIADGPAAAAGDNSTSSGGIAVIRRKQCRFT